MIVTWWWLVVEVVIVEEVKYCKPLQLLQPLQHLQLILGNAYCKLPHQSRRIEIFRLLSPGA
jgi:hypothetical protein